MISCEQEIKIHAFFSSQKALDRCKKKCDEFDDADKNTSKIRKCRPTIHYHNWTIIPDKDILQGLKEEFDDQLTFYNICSQLDELEPKEDIVVSKIVLDRRAQFVLWTRKMRSKL